MILMRQGDFETLSWDVLLGWSCMTLLSDEFQVGQGDFETSSWDVLLGWSILLGSMAFLASLCIGEVSANIKK